MVFFSEMARNPERLGTRTKQNANKWLFSMILHIYYFLFQKNRSDS